MPKRLLKPREVDLILRYAAGKTLRLAHSGRMPHVVLPDGAVRIRESDLERIINGGEGGDRDRDD